MICRVCGSEMREFQEYYRCSNNSCKIKRNKCLATPGPVDLHPRKHSRFSQAQKDVMRGTAIMGFVITGFMIFLGGI